MSYETRFCFRCKSELIHRVIDGIFTAPNGKEITVPNLGVYKCSNPLCDMMFLDHKSTVRMSEVALKYS